MRICSAFLPSGIWRSLAGALGIAAILLTSGCGRRESQVDRATREQILLVGNGAEPADLDPQTITGEPENKIVSVLFEGLTRNEPHTLEAQPGVAETWDVSPDGLRYTFHLRADAKWSDGRALTSHDFLNSFRRVLSPELASDNADSMFPVVNAEAYQKGTLKDFDQVGFRAIDDHTLEVRLQYPAGFLPKVMASRVWFPVPLHVMEKFGSVLKRGSEWTRPENLVGNGPFVLKEWLPNRHVEVRRSPTYWNRASVRLNGIRFIPIESQLAEEAAFRAGQLHMTQFVPISKLDVYRAQAPDRLRIHPYSGVYYYNFNVTRPPFNDVRLRRALAMAVDRESLVKNVTRAGETPAYHFTIEGIDGYVSRARTRQDFAAARKLLADAGYPGGRGLPPITLLYNTSENHRAIAEVIQQTWKRELGLDLRLENQEWRVYLASMDQKAFEICRAGLVMEPYDPSQFLRVFAADGGFNRTGWSDPEYSRLYEEVMRTVDPGKRQELMQRMEEILTEAMPILPIYYYTKQYLIHPAVHGMVENLMGDAPFDRMWVE
jgi:oligopeptide transport system substrate-binding protein